MNLRHPAALFTYVALAWGGSFVAIKTGLANVPPVLYAAFRFDVGFVVLATLVLATTARSNVLPSTRTDVLSVLVSGVLIVAFNNGFLFVGQQYLTSGVAAIIYSLNPILSVGLTRMFLPSQRLAADELAGVALGLVGVVIVAHPSPSSLLSESTLGLALVFVAAASVAVGSVFSNRLSGGSLSTAAVTMWAMAVGAVLLHASAFAVDQHLADATVTTDLLLALAYLGVVATALAYVCYFELIATAGAIYANLVAYIVPLVAAFAGWLLLGEAITAFTVVGFAVVLAGFVLLNRERLSRAFPA
ncbi:DMT family transporter [Salarchaeum japonicum]|uniref:DMT family transporter n=1 Tax=Salarchaeum japonicum TaxID=555573 RepID=UPI003C7581F0